MKEIAHPELGEGEVFVTNALMNARYNSLDINGHRDSLNGFESCGWKTKRLGKVAYRTDDSIAEGYRPVFAQREELKKAGIMDVVPDATEIDLYRQKGFYCAKLSGAGDSLHAQIRYQRVSKRSYQEAIGKLALEIQVHFRIHVVLGKDKGKVKSVVDENCLLNNKLIVLFKDKPMLQEEEVFYAKYAGTILMGSSENSDEEALGNLFWTEQEGMKVSFNMVD